MRWLTDMSTVNIVLIVLLVLVLVGKWYINRQIKQLREELAKHKQDYEDVCKALAHAEDEGEFMCIIESYTNKEKKS